MNKYDVLIIDVYNIYHKNYAKLSHLTHQVGNSQIVTGGIYGALRSFEKYQKDFLKEDGCVYYLSDNPTSKLLDRKAIDPEYKLNRIKRSPEFYRNIQFLLMILMNHNSKDFVVQKDGVEADDFVKAIIQNISKEKSVLLISSDMDWARMINYDGRNIQWYDTNSIMYKADFIQKYGFNPSEKTIVNYKTFRGDGSDNIESGLPHLPEKLLLQLIDYEDIYDILDNLEIISFLSDKWKEKIKQQAPRLILNYKLVSFIEISETDIQKFITLCQYKPAYLKLLYQSLGFKIESIDPRLINVFFDDDKIKNKEIDDFFIFP